MTRKETLSLLREARKRYRGSSKFSGEPDATLYYYEAYMNGDGEPRGVEGEFYTVHSVDAAEREVLDLPKGTTVYVLYEDSQGFVSGEAMNEKQYARFDEQIGILEEEGGEGY
jgi:hypothetical protein